MKNKNMKILFLVLSLFALSSCHKKKEEHTHDFSVVQYNENGHWYTCPEDGQSNDNVEEHRFNCEITKEATCGVEGKRKCTCSVCGYSYEETIDATGIHSWNDGQVTREATIEENGIKTFTCLECGQTKEVEIPYGHHHSWGAGVVTKPATQEETGIMTYTCTICGDIRNEEIPVLPPLGTEFTVSINKTTWYVGQTIEYTDFIVYAQTDCCGLTLVDDFDFTLEGKELELTDTSVIVSYGQYSETINITVLDPSEHIKELDIICEPGVVIDEETKLTDILLYRYVYDDESYSDYTLFNEGEVELVQNDNKLVITGTVNGHLGTLVVANKELERKLVLPDKLVYTIGEELDLTGAKIIVKFAYGEKRRVEVTNDLVDTTGLDMNTANTYNLSCKYEGVDYPFTIEVVKPVQSIQLVKPLTDTLIHDSTTSEELADRFENNALLVTYTDQTSETINIEPIYLSTNRSFGDMEITITYGAATCGFNVVCHPDGMTIEQIKSLAKGTEVTGYGVVIGTNYVFVPNKELTIDQVSPEYIIKDLVTNTWITLIDSPFALNKGDVIEFTSKISAYSSTSDSTYKLLDSTTNLEIVANYDNENSYKLDLSNAITISNNAQWRDTFSDDNRLNTFNTVYKLHANIRCVAYNGSTYRICFPEATNYGYGETKQYFNSSLSGVLRSFSFESNTSYKFEDLFTATGGYSSATQCGKDIYVIYLGSSGAYYGNFAVVGDYCIVDSTPIVQDYEVEGFKTSYETGSEFDLTDTFINVKCAYTPHNTTVPVTSDMLVLPEGFNNTTTNLWTIKVKYNDQIVGEFEVLFSPAIEKIEVVNYEEQYVYWTGDSIEDIDLTNVQLKCTDTLGGTFNIELKKDYLSEETISDVIKYDDCGYYQEKPLTVSYLGKTTSLIVRVWLPQASDVLNGLSGSVTFQGIVVGHNFRGNNGNINSKANPDIIVKDVLGNGTTIIRGLYNTYNCNIGDLIKITGTCAKGTSGADNGVRRIDYSTGINSEIKKITNPAQLQYDLSLAKEYNSWAELKGENDSLEKRASQFGRLIKIKNVVMIKYADRIYRITTTDCTSYSANYFGSTSSNPYSPTIIDIVWEEVSTTPFLTRFADNIAPAWGDYDNTTPLDYVYMIQVGGTGAYYLDYFIPGEYCLPQGGTL